MTYGSRLQQALDQAHKNRKSLASHIGCSVQAIGMVINIKVDRPLRAVASAKAARFLRVNHYWLATGEGEMFLTNSDMPLSDPSLDTVAQVLDKLGEQLLSLPDCDRDAVSRLMSAFILAPDSTKLLTALKKALGNSN